MGNAPGSLGAQLEDRYFLQKVKLGQGSFGTVWRAVDRQKGHTVAIKQLDKASLPRRGVTRQDIEREIALMRVCLHENITQIFDTFENNASIYLALEYCDGGDFGDKVKERGWAMDEGEVAGYMRQICAAISALHSKGICHRDIKPDNFMVSGTSALKLADFGLAQSLPQGHVCRDKCGTPAFMAPELYNLPRRSPGYTRTVDLWAAGVSMYMVMFAGRHPFVTEQGHLDEGMLLAGELDFRSREAFKGFFNFGCAGLRFSEEARAFCKRLVEPDARRRVSIEEALASRWLQNCPVSPERQPVARRVPSRASSQALSPAPPYNEKSGSPKRCAAHVPKPRSPPEPRPEIKQRGCENLDPNPGQTEQRTPRGERKPTKIVEDEKAAKEAERLKEENDALQAELSERRKREEVLVQQQRQLKEQQRHLNRQRSKELHAQNERLLQRELLLRRTEQEKRQLEQLAVRTGTAEQAKAIDSPVRDEPTMMTGQVLPGTRCRYVSGTYGWMPAVVQNYNQASSTYNLDVRQHAALDKIAPAADVTACEAWPPGTLAAYHSVSVNQWLPAVVVSFNEADGTYNLDVRDHADPERMRARALDRTPCSSEGRRGSESEEQNGAGQP